jgi:hypothetical protein
MTTINGSVEWPVVYAGTGCESLMDSEADQDRFEQMAAEFLWNWTRGQFGIDTVVYRPCRSTCVGIMDSTYWGSGPYPDNGTRWNPVLIDGKWYSVRCGICHRDACGCDRASIIELPGPVAAVTEILVDGETLVAGTDYLVDGLTVWRLQGNSWPTCQEFTKPVTEEGTWQITYERGVEVPVGGQTAAGVLACEFAKAFYNDSSCRLPQRIQSVTRQGVSMTILDAFDNVEQGRTGIWTVDSWVASVNNPKRGGTVASPEKYIGRTKDRFRRVR